MSGYIDVLRGEGSEIVSAHYYVVTGIILVCIGLLQIVTTIFLTSDVASDKLVTASDGSTEVSHN